MGRRFWLSRLKQILAACAAAYLLTVAYQHWDRPEYGEFHPWRDAWIGVALYLGASLALGLVNAAGGIIYLTLDKGTDFEEFVLDDLRRAKLPPPKGWQSTRLEYVAQVADDEHEEVRIRVRAAAVHGAMSTASKSLGFFRGLAFEGAADRAVLRYAAEAPKERRPDNW